MIRFQLFPKSSCHSNQLLRKFATAKTGVMMNFRSSSLSGVILLTLSTIVFFSSCKKPLPEPITPIEVTGDCSCAMPMGEDWSFVYPSYFQEPIIPADNPMKVEAIALGRFLFWEKNLSADNTQSCASCHSPQTAFTDPLQFSVGIDGISGTRNSMPLINMAWVNNGFFWDGRAETLEKQVLEPVTNPIEMHNTWDNALAQLADDPLYPPLFEAAFGSTCIDSIRSAKALAQFIRTMVSANSKYDKFKIGQAFFTESELLGLSQWDIEGGDPDLVAGGQLGGDCFHCHPIPGGQFRDNQFHNNGLDTHFSDPGRAGVTGLASDSGLFKVPTLRNIEYTAPYMHDGRFATLEEVMEHYNSGGHSSSTVDVNMLGDAGGLFLTPEKKQGFIDFLKSLSDPDFINNPDFSDPH